jgi:hypothetical protein
MNGVRDRVVVAVAPGTSTDAVGTAFELAAERGISVLAVRAWHDPDVPLGGWLRPHGTAQWDALHQKAREELDRAVEHAKAAHPAVEVEMVVVDDDPVDDDPVPFLGRTQRPGRAARPRSPAAPRTAGLPRRRAHPAG